MPVGTVLYVVGDIHGRADCLEEIFERIDRDPSRGDFDRTLEIYLGDYVDRGPDSKKVISLLIERVQSGAVLPLLGNHEAILMEALQDVNVVHGWRTMGGLETMMSYGADVRLPLSEAHIEAMHEQWLDVFPDSHREFLSNLMVTAQEGDYFFVHAGVKPGTALPDQAKQDLIWIRDEFLESHRWHGKVIVHGHTPVERPEFLPHRINIDTGAYLTGNLTCLRLDGTSQTVLEGG